MKLRNTAILPHKLLIPLSILYVTIYLASTAVAYKVVAIGPFVDPGPPFIFPISYMLGAIISEVYGSNVSKLIIWSTLCCQILFALFITMVVKLPHPKEWIFQSSYNHVFGNIVHFVFSGTLAVLLSNFINIYIVAKFKVLMSGRYFILRAIVSNAIGGLLLILTIVLLVYLPAFGFKRSIVMLLSIYPIEIMYTLVLAVPAKLACSWMKRIEKLDVFDYDVRLNPFKFT